MNGFVRWGACLVAGAIAGSVAASGSVAALVPTVEWDVTWETSCDATFTGSVTFTVTHTGDESYVFDFSLYDSEDNLVLEESLLVPPGGDPSSADLSVGGLDPGEYWFEVEGTNETGSILLGSLSDEFTIVCVDPEPTTSVPASTTTSSSTTAPATPTTAVGGAAPSTTAAAQPLPSVGSDSGRLALLASVMLLAGGVLVLVRSRLGRA